MSAYDEIKNSFVSLVKAAFPRMKFLGSYPAKVVQQNGDGTLDLIPDDPTIPEHQGVPIRYGVPGVEADVSPGARVQLEFAGADPSRPYVTVWESASVIELRIDATLINLNNGSPAEGVARVGDTVVAGPYAGTITSGSASVRAGTSV